MLLLTLRGTPTIYYGEEIGMSDVAIPKEEIQDPQGLNMPELNLSRDPSRTPMQWDDSPHAGFSKAKPWLRLPYHYPRINVKAQTADTFSMLNFYRKLIHLRKSEAALNVGDYRSVFSDKQIISYIREVKDSRFLIVLNLSHRPCFFTPQQLDLQGLIELSTEEERSGLPVSGTLTLEGDEGIVIRLKR
jgi:alpha-glucosidase